MKFRFPRRGDADFVFGVTRWPVVTIATVAMTLTARAGLAPLDRPSAACSQPQTTLSTPLLRRLYPPGQPSSQGGCGH